MNKMNILIIQQRNWASKFGIPLSKFLKGKGHNLSAITVKKSAYNEVIKNNINDYVWSHDEIVNNPKLFLNEHDNTTLEEISDFLQINSVWSLIQSQRNLVKSYKKKYYYSFKQAVSDEHIELYIKSCFKLYNEIFIKFKPDIIISPTLNSFLHASLNLFANKNGIPTLAVTDSKVSKISIFTNSYLDNQGKFYDNLRRINQGKSSINNEIMSKAETFIKEEKKKLKLKININKKQKINFRYLRLVFKNFIRSFKYSEKDYPLGPTQDLGGPMIFIRDLFYQHYYDSASSNFKYNDLDKIKNFAYMPLLLQPEENMDLISTEFNNQIETARQIAMNLPSDMTLVVRDHPDMHNKRPPSYLKKIQNLPNVKLIDYRISNPSVLQKTKIVIAASGTSIFEAAILEVPVIQLGKLGTTQNLPNVTSHSEIKSLKEKVKTVLNSKIDKYDYFSKLKNFIYAANQFGIQYNKNGAWENSENTILELFYEEFYKEIIRLTNFNSSSKK